MRPVLAQTWALAVDAYRELNSKKLFWITLGLSGLVVIVFAMLGINEDGITFLHWTIDSPLTTALVKREQFYLLAFANVGVPFWLTWIAGILALISTASIFPDFLAGGAIEMSLSKPIGRARLFVTKFLLAMLFVAMQVFVFTFACFLVIGFRGGTWEFRVFLALPIVLLFFSYLFAFCSLMGLLTRSTIASLLLTLLFWFAMWGIQSTDHIFVAQHAGKQLAVERIAKDVEVRENAARQIIERLRSEGKPIPGEGAPLSAGASDALESVNVLVRSARLSLAKERQSEEQWRLWKLAVFAIRTPLPKTEETIGLLDRALFSSEEIRQFGREADSADFDEEAVRDMPRFMNPRAGVRAAREIRARPVWWVMGTSVGFVVLVLGVSCLIFARRDF